MENARIERFPGSLRGRNRVSLSSTVDRECHHHVQVTRLGNLRPWDLRAESPCRHGRVRDRFSSPGCWRKEDINIRAPLRPGGEPRHGARRCDSLHRGPTTFDIDRRRPLIAIVGRRSAECSVQNILGVDVGVGISVGVSDEYHAKGGAPASCRSRRCFTKIHRDLGVFSSRVESMKQRQISSPP